MIKEVTVEPLYGAFKIKIAFQSLHLFVYDFTVLDEQGNVLQQLTKGSSNDDKADEYSFVADKKYNNAYFLFSPVKIVTPSGNYKFTIEVYQDVIKVDELIVQNSSNDTIAYENCGIKIKINLP